jgi:hypothetical protein
MPKRKKSSKAPNKPSPLSRAAQWEQAVRDGDQEKIKALGRRDPNDPNDVPEKDTYIQIDDLVEGASITGPAAAARPKLTVWVSQDDFTEWMIVTVRIRDHFVREEKRTGHRVLKKDGLSYIMQCEPPPGKEMTPHMARNLFTICRKVADMSGGLLSRKKNG